MNEPAPAPPLVELRGVSRSYGGVHAVEDVSLAIEAGRTHALVGENGAGKSTLVKILTGVVAPDEGEILVDGESAHGRVGAEVDPEVAEEPARLAAHLGPVHGPEPSPQAASREDVLHHRQVGEDGRLLVHRDDSEPVRRLRVADALRLPVEQ